MECLSIFRIEGNMFDRIYLGDRPIKKLNLIYGANKLEFRWISRIAYGTTEWNFYNNEDLENGYLVFTDVTFFNIIPNGSIPDDYIVSIITDKVNVECFESTIVAVGQIRNTNVGDIDNIGECQILIRYKDRWIENKLKEKIIE